MSGSQGDMTGLTPQQLMALMQTLGARPSQSDVQATLQAGTPMAGYLGAGAGGNPGAMALAPGAAMSPSMIAQPPGQTGPMLQGGAPNVAALLQMLGQRPSQAAIQAAGGAAGLGQWGQPQAAEVGGFGSVPDSLVPNPLAGDASAERVLTPQQWLDMIRQLRGTPEYPRMQQFNTPNP